MCQVLPTIIFQVIDPKSGQVSEAKQEIVDFNCDLKNYYFFYVYYTNNYKEKKRKKIIIIK